MLSIHKQERSTGEQIEKKTELSLCNVQNTNECTSTIIWIIVQKQDPKPTHKHDSGGKKLHQGRTSTRPEKKPNEKNTPFYQ